MKNLFKIAAAVAVAAPFTGAIAVDNADIMAKLQQLEAIVQQQQAEITALRGDNTANRALVADLVQEEVDAVLDARISEGLAAIKDSSSLSLGAGIDGLSLTGDARFRYENLDDISTPADGDTYGVRLRVGGVWTNKSDDTEIGVGVTLGAGRASDSTYGTGFTSTNLNLDYAYAKHNMDAFSVTIGQMINPFVTSDILWDEDVRPVGIVGGFADAGFFATVGVLNFNDAAENIGGGNGAEALIVAGQIGIKSDGEDANYSLALGYYHGNGETGNDVMTGGGAGSANDYDVQILDVVGSFNTTAGDIGLGIHGHYAVNFGADGAAGGSQAVGTPDDEDQAYSIGITAGLEKFSAGYTFKHIESDSVIAALNDNDFGRGIGSTNVEGHEFGVGYSISDNIDLGLNVFLYEAINGTADGELYQLDLSYQF